MSYKYAKSFRKPNVQKVKYLQPQQEFKITSGAKKARCKEGFGVSAWKKTRAGFLSFYFNATHSASGKTKAAGHKMCVETQGKNGQTYYTSVPVSILNKDTMQKSTAWGIWSVSGQTLTVDSLGIYITLRNGGFVGRIKS